MSGNSRYLQQSGGTGTTISGSGSFDSNRPTTRSGVPVVNVGGTTVDNFLEGYFFPAIGPGITLSSSPTGGLREFGNDIASIDLSATTVKHTNPITAVTFYRDAILINTVGSPNPTGGVETYTDGSGISAATTYTAKASDGSNTTTSNAISFTFVYAYYYGVGAQGLSPSAVGALSKIVQGNTATVTKAFTTSNQVYYFAYPDSYPALTSILDTNGFETISDWNVSTGNSITNAYSATDTYRIYEFKNLNSNTNFNNTFKQ